MEDGEDSIKAGGTECPLKSDRKYFDKWQNEHPRMYPRESLILPCPSSFLLGTQRYYFDITSPRAFLLEPHTSCIPTHFLIQSLTDRGFTWMQYIATVMCSVAVAALAIAAFLPAVVGCCAWVKSLAITGGVLMLFYAVFQFVSLVLAKLVLEEFDYIGECNTQYQASVVLQNTEKELGRSASGFVFGSMMPTIYLHIASNLQELILPRK